MHTVHYNASATPKQQSQHQPVCTQAFENRTQLDSCTRVLCSPTDVAHQACSLCTHPLATLPFCSASPLLRLHGSSEAVSNHFNFSACAPSNMFRPIPLHSHCPLALHPALLQPNRQHTTASHINGCYTAAPTFFCCLRSRCEPHPLIRNHNTSHNTRGICRAQQVAHLVPSTCVRPHHSLQPRTTDVCSKEGSQAAHPVLTQA
jgi:hypothetical protein